MILLLFAAGLALRCMGFAFGGIADTDEMIFKWGASAREMGLARAFSENYGLFSYALFGAAAGWAENVPMFWWIPYKGFVLLFDLLTLGVLAYLGGREKHRKMLWLYWVNPFFAFQGAWLGFWDGPHTFLVLAVIAVLSGRAAGAAAWFAAGLLIGIAAMFKPQGFFYFLPPLVLYALSAFVLERNRGRPISFFLGVALVFTLSTVYLVVGGAPVAAIPLNLRTAVRHMPNLCNECFNVWRPVARLAQMALGQTGPVFTLDLPRPTYTIINGVTSTIVLSSVAVFTLFFYASRRNFAEPPSLSDAPQTARAVRILGVTLLVLTAAGFLRPSDPTQHAVLYGGRYSPAYALFLGGGLTAAAALILGSRHVARLTRRLLEFLAHRTSGSLHASTPNPTVGFGLLLAFPALVIPHFATRAHENHAFTGLVLLIPLMFSVPGLFKPWLGMIVIHSYAYLTKFGVGISLLVPSRPYPFAAHLLEKVASAEPGEPGQTIRALQATINGWVEGTLSLEPALSILSFVQFLLAIWVVRSLLCKVVSWRTNTPPPMMANHAIGSASLEKHV